MKQKALSIAALTGLSAVIIATAIVTANPVALAGGLLVLCLSLSAAPIL